MEVVEEGGTGFFKATSDLDANPNADLREHLASEILGDTGVPVAETRLATNGDQNGVISMSVVRENESLLNCTDAQWAYVGDPTVKAPNPCDPFEQIDAFVQQDTYVVERALKDIDPSLKVPSDRDEYVVKQLVERAMVGDTDMYVANMPPVVNNKTGTVRNVEGFDYGEAFTPKGQQLYPDGSDNNVDFLNNLYQHPVYGEIAKKHASEMLPQLEKVDMDEVLSQPKYSGLSLEQKSVIKETFEGAVETTRENVNN